mmetsp:Transcript_1876/g.3356  ORF Transcript_1876/g.3356 Transcript_1876/m.3356 type:complete len:633 (-) Transcript_1876:1882-3780(-)
MSSRIAAEGPTMNDDNAEFQKLLSSMSKNTSIEEQINLDHLTCGGLTVRAGRGSNAASPRDRNKRQWEDPIETNRNIHSTSASASRHHQVMSLSTSLDHSYNQSGYSGSSNKKSLKRSWQRMVGHFVVLLYTRPRCIVASILVTMLVSVSIFSRVVNPLREAGVVHHDYSDIQSIYDLSMGKIDHWCLQGGDDSCTCEDPLMPTIPEYGTWAKSWATAHAKNKELIEPYLEPLHIDATPIDVAFLGESVVEEMNGRWKGVVPPESKVLETVVKGFRKFFSKAEGAEIEGVALGIAGDTSPGVLWRLQNGEMPLDFNPQVWWISLGMNDLTRTKCSEEVVVLGILRVVEEILIHKPRAKIVINSLFPMADMRGGNVPREDDYADSPKLATAGREQNMRRHLRDSLFSKHEFQKNDIDPFSLRDLEEETAPKSLLSKLSWNYWKKKPTAPKDNPYLLESHKYRKHDAKSLYLRTNKFPLWTSIRAINEELRLFCEKHERVTFFDATKLFTTSHDLPGVVARHQFFLLRVDRISAKGHPTQEGFRLWQKSIAQELLHMLTATPTTIPNSLDKATKEENSTNTNNDNTWSIPVLDDDEFRSIVKKSPNDTFEQHEDPYNWTIADEHGNGGNEDEDI